MDFWVVIWKKEQFEHTENTISVFLFETHFQNVWKSLVRENEF